MPYISAKFEKDTLTSLNKERIIVLNLDQGGVPPPPSAVYFPTDPDGYQTFILAEYNGLDALGESVVIPATLADLTTYQYRPLNIINDPSGNLALAQVGDLLEIFLTDSTLWTSDEYPASNFIFTVQSPLIDSNNVTVSPAIPSFLSNFSWQISRVSGFTTSIITQGSAGTTHRPGITYPGIVQKFLDKRFNSYFDSAIDAQNYVEATKASMTGLANEILGTSLVDENYTASPTI